MSIKAILSTLHEKVRENEEETAYRVYMAECARVLTENSAKTSNGQYMKKRYIDIINRDKKPEIDGSAIAADVIKRAGLVVK